MGNINWLGVLAGLVAGQFIGFLWYGVIFKNAWVKLMGITPEPGKGAGAAMAVGAVVNLVTVIGLAFLVAHFGDRADWMSGAHAGLFVATFFAATTVALRAVYSHDTFTARPWKLFLIDAGYLLVYFPIAGAILGCLQKA